MKVILKDFTMNYLKEGEGPALILLHGNGENAHIFDEAILLLKKQYTIYAIDSRGHGKSKANVDQYHYSVMAEDLHQFIEALHIDHFYLYGFSDGGIIALLYAIQYPKTIKKLIVSGANLYPEGLYPDCLQEISQNFLHATSENEKKLCQLMLNEPNISPEMLHKITCPTLILVGEKDVIMQDHSILISQCIPSSTLKILAGETHESYIVHSQKIASEISNFIDN